MKVDALLCNNMQNSEEESRTKLPSRCAILGQAAFPLRLVPEELLHCKIKYVQVWRNEKLIYYVESMWKDGRNVTKTNSQFMDFVTPLQVETLG